MSKRGPKKKLWKPVASWFWERVNKQGPQLSGMESPCWLWDRWCSDGGYGMVRPTTRKEQKEFAILTAHRVSWELENGPIPENSLVLHRCDNPACVRPSHLFLGDDKTNMDDMYQKKRGRKAQGEKQHLAKLTGDAVRIIRLERSKTPPTPIKELAIRFGVSTPAINYAAIGKTWKHVR